jgi:hypothetical protein
MNLKAEQARWYRWGYHHLADLLDDALAEAGRVADAEGGPDFPLGRFGKLLIELGQGAYALRRYLAGRREASHAEARRQPGRRPHGHQR